jgi:hypothetical protein
VKLDFDVDFKASESDSVIFISNYIIEKIFTVSLPNSAKCDKYLYSLFLGFDDRYTNMSQILKKRLPWNSKLYSFSLPGFFRE